jgi:fructosamine-3-kinase
MPVHDDISWQTLRRIVREWAGESAELTEVKPLEGGAINTTLALTCATGEKCVIKISPHRVNRDYAREAYQLDLLRNAGLPTPKVYEAHIGSLEDPNSYLLMEFIEGIDLAEAKRRCDAEQFDRLQSHLAELVLAMHAHSSTSYCRCTGHDAKLFATWPAFYREVYDPIWHDVEKDGHLAKPTRKLISKVHEKLDRLIAHGDSPRLVHWDIWATNLLAAPDESGNWRITGVLDPNCKFAHAEAEIAYIDLFHTCTPAFLKTYQQTRKLDEAYHRVRKPIYQLYPMINHVHLFGHPYVTPLSQAAERCAGLV